MTTRARALACGLLIAIGLVTGAAADDDAPAPKDNASVLVQTAPVAARDVASTLTAYGVLDADPDQVLSLSLARAGIISRVWVRLGQRVQRGDRLLEIATAPDARMQYLQARSAVDYAQRELQRQQRLLAEQLATGSQVDAARKNLKDARDTLQALQQRGQGKASEILRAPMDGIVTRLDVSQGQRVAADTTAMLIAAQQRLVARLGIEPEDLAQVQPGTPVTITAVFVPDVKIATSVREVHAMIDPTTHLVDVLAAIPPGKQQPLVLGSRIVAHLQLNAHHALVVPHSAVLGGVDHTYVFTVQGGKAHRVAIATGIDTGNLIEVRKGLHQGDIVVTSGNYELEDGMAVREAR